MKKFSLLLCVVSALFFVTSCDHTLTPTTTEPEPTTPETQDPPGGTPAAPTFEYTAENDIPAEQAPFDARKCYEAATVLEFSDGAWTLVMSTVIPNMFNEKNIAKATASNNTLTINSGIIKIDIPFDEEEDSEEDLPDSDEAFESVFNEIKAMWIEGGVEDAEKYTFTNGYLTESKKVVLIIDATEYTKELFNLANLTGTIKSNPSKTKYVITITNESGNISIPLYIYKDANLNDEETIPEGTETPETPGTSGTEEPEEPESGSTGTETPETPGTSEPEEPEDPESGNTGTETPETPGTSEPEEPESGNTGAEPPETPTSPAVNYTAENDVPATTQPFTADICPLSGTNLSFSNGNWTVVDIWTSSQFAAKIISKITYDNTKENPYNCTSIIYKFDFPRQNLPEDEVDFEVYFENIRTLSDLAAIKDVLSFSHGYLTDTSIVIIAETPVEVFALMYLSKLNTITNPGTNLTQSKYCIINGMYETIYIYKDSEELSAEESNVFLQGTGIQYDTHRLINSMNVGDGDPAPFDSEYFNSSDEFDNSKIILADGEWTLVQNQIYTLSDGSIQETIGYFKFSSEDQKISFIEGKELQKVDLRFFEQMILQEAPEVFIAEYATLTTDREKFNYIISSGATGELPANMIFAFVDGKILVVNTLPDFPSNMTVTTQSTNPEISTYYTLDYSSFIKTYTTVKSNADNTQYIFTTVKTAENNTDTTITYLIKNN